MQAGRDIMFLRDLRFAAVLLLLLSVQSLHGSALPAVSSYEFTAYRMQQFNLAQQKHGEFREREISPMSCTAAQLDIFNF